MNAINNKLILPDGAAFRRNFEISNRLANEWTKCHGIYFTAINVGAAQSSISDDETWTISDIYS